MGFSLIKCGGIGGLGWGFEFSSGFGVVVRSSNGRDQQLGLRPSSSSKRYV